MVTPATRRKSGLALSRLLPQWLQMGITKHLLIQAPWDSRFTAKTGIPISSRALVAIPAQFQYLDHTTILRTCTIRPSHKWVPGRRLIRNLLQLAPQVVEGVIGAVEVTSSHERCMPVILLEEVIIMEVKLCEPSPHASKSCANPHYESHRQ